MKDLNFFSEYILQKKRGSVKAAVIYAVIAILLLLVAGSYIYTDSIANGIEKNISTMEGYLKSPQTMQKIKEIGEIKLKTDILTQYSVQLSASQTGIESLHLIGSKLMDTLSQALPSEIFMKSLDFSGGSIKIKGTADVRLTVAELSYNFSSLGIFTNVHIAKIISEEEAAGRYNFEAECALGGATEP